MKFNYVKNCIMALMLAAMGAGMIECYRYEESRHGHGHGHRRHW